MPDAPLPILSLRSVVFDCPDPAELARFYAELLGGQARTADDEWCEVRFEGPGPKLAFQRVTDYSAPQWPSGPPQQAHLDITVPDLDAASRRAIDLGARVLGPPVTDPDCVFRVHADPAGHPFCLCENR